MYNCLDTDGKWLTIKETWTVCNMTQGIQWNKQKGHMLKFNQWEVLHRFSHFKSNIVKTPTFPDGGILQWGM